MSSPIPNQRRFGMRPTGGAIRWSVVIVLICLSSLLLAVRASSIFVGPTGLLVDQPLSVQGTDVGAALLSLQSQLTSQAAELRSQRVEISELRANLTATNAVVASQAATIAALSSLSGDSLLVQTVVATNLSSAAIGDLTSPSTIVAVVLALRGVTSQLSTSVTVLDGTVANQSVAITQISGDLTAIESITGDSLLVSTVNSLSNGLTSLTLTVDAIADLTGSSTIVSTVESIMDSMTDQATEIATLQTLQTATTQMLTTLSQTVSSQVTLINNKMDAEDAALQAEITALQDRATADETLISTNAAAITVLQNRASDDETLIANNAASITALQQRATDDEALIIALQNRATNDETLISNNAVAITTLQNRASNIETAATSLTTRVTAAESLTGSTTLVTTVLALRDLTGSSTLVSTVNSLSSTSSTHTNQIAALQATVASLNFVSIATTVGVINPACTAGTDPNPPDYDESTYRVTCGNRYCRSIGYNFGIINENNNGWVSSKPYSSPATASAVVSCSK